MAKRKKRMTLVDDLEEAVTDVADAVSVAATGSQLGVLELAAEDELAPPAPRRRRKSVRKTKVGARKRKRAKPARTAPIRKRKTKSRKASSRRR